MPIRNFPQHWTPIFVLRLSHQVRSDWRFKPAAAAFGASSDRFFQASNKVKATVTCANVKARFMLVRWAKAQFAFIPFEVAARL